MTTTTRPARQPRPIPGHGTSSRYRGDQRNNRWQPCRCEPCRTASRRRRKTANLRVARGGTARYDTAPVAAHIQRLLNAGWGQQQIADKAGVDRKTLYNAVHGVYPTVDYDTAAKILRLDPASTTGIRVNPIGAARRIQALAAIGWPMAWTAQQSGISHHSILRIVGNTAQEWISIDTHQAIDRVYRSHGSKYGPSGWTRAFAAKRAWVSLAAWDDIDDPACVPNVGLRIPRYVALAEDGLELEDQGHTRQQAADRLGVTKNYLQQSITRYRNDLEQAA